MQGKWELTSIFLGRVGREASIRKNKLLETIEMADSQIVTL